MIFVADESVDQQIVIELRKSGHQVTFVAEMEPGISDKAVLELANKQNAVLITADKDFGEIVFRQRQIITGVILIRLAGLSQESKSLVVSRMIEKHLKQLEGSFTVVSPTRIRMRKAIRF